MQDEQHDPLEQQLRATLRAPGVGGGTDADAFLDRVHRGARRRRMRRTAAGGAVAVGLVAVGGIGLAASGLLGSDGQAPVADDTTRTTTGSVGTDAPTASETRTSEAPGLTAEEVVALDVSATDVSRQWILGSVPGGECGERRCLRVFETGSAGESWVDLGELPAVPITGTEDPTTADVLRFAPDASNGWAFRGGLFSTHDGGETWAAPELPVRGNVIQLVPSAEAALATVQTAQGDVLLRSPVDTDDWQVVPLDEQVGTPLDQAAITDVAVSGDTAVLVVTSAPSYLGTLLTSADQGETWGPPPVEVCASNEAPYAVSTSVDDAWWVACLGRSQSNFRLRVSADAGQQWDDSGGAFRSDASFAARDAERAVVARSLGLTGTRVEISESSPTDSASEPVGEIEAAGWVTDISFTDVDTGYLVFDGGGIRRTDDGGRSWLPFTVTSLD